METGDIIKANGNTGVVIDVYTSEGGKNVIQVMFVRNIMKIQPPELHLESTFFSIEPATKEDMEAEFQSFLELQYERMEELVRSAETSIVYAPVGELVYPPRLERDAKA